VNQCRKDRIDPTVCLAEIKRKEMFSLRNRGVFISEIESPFFLPRLNMRG
jgi:hypothetical protein